jgi:hypothetical protein
VAAAPAPVVNLGSALWKQIAAMTASVSVPRTSGSVEAQPARPREYAGVRDVYMSNWFSGVVAHALRDEEPSLPPSVTNFVGMCVVVCRGPKLQVTHVRGAGSERDVVLKNGSFMYLQRPSTCPQAFAVTLDALCFVAMYAPLFFLS